MYQLKIIPIDTQFSSVRSVSIAWVSARGLTRQEARDQQAFCPGARGEHVFSGSFKLLADFSPCESRSENTTSFLAIVLESFLAPRVPGVSGLMACSKPESVDGSLTPPSCLSSASFLWPHLLIHTQKCAAWWYLDSRMPGKFYFLFYFTYLLFQTCNMYLFLFQENYVKIRTNLHI